ncbi:hypothetical protein PoB_003031100 [Plakobranchus ocellatus]|uniref:Secreted protein n=1 Tax=Plakobranchus ocellatus TaxID=259542 RepID=A0AAV3ZXX3_9GAST|nr:hypothetical protein PoB_003031100 [Plakobranchus ocellatus]
MFINTHIITAISFSFLYVAAPQQGDLKLSCPPSGQGAGSGTRTATEGSLQISGWTLRQARSSTAGHESTTDGSLQISGRIRYPLRYQQSQIMQMTKRMTVGSMIKQLTTVLK